VTPTTVDSWTTRLENEDPAAIVRMREPVNKFSDFVASIVRQLKVLCPPATGKVKIAQILCRVGPHISTPTIGRHLHQPLPSPPNQAPAAAEREIKAKRPDHFWLSDRTTVPTAVGLWTSRLPFALPRRWPFCGWASAAPSVKRRTSRST
jgi:hypothetical protein